MAACRPEASPKLTGLMLRPAWEDEKRRVAQLFPEAARPGDCFVAVRERPVERIVGAAFWRELPTADEGREAEFLWAVLPALAENGGEVDFLLAFKEMLALSGRFSRIRSAEPLPDGASTQCLQACGFQADSRQDCYVGAWGDWVNRTRHLLARRKGRAGVELTTRAPGMADEAALAALAASQDLLPPGAVQAAFSGGDAAAPFDLNHSALLFQEERLVGACLVKAVGRHLTLCVLAAEDSVAAGLACALLFDHCQNQFAGHEPYEVLFRINPDLHPAASRMARRFACRVVGALTAWGMALSDTGNTDS